ncbi:MAG: hypothetical protein Q7S31_03450 [bacterium]|nr:hypothetical protein [bacterium]
MNGEIKAYAISSPQAPRDKLCVLRVNQELATGSVITDGEGWEQVYWGENDLIGKLFVPAIITALIRSGQSIGLLYHPDNEFSISVCGTTLKT